MRERVEEGLGSAVVRKAIGNSTPTAVDYQIYRSPEIFEAEQQAIYQGPTWSYLGLEAEVPNPGDFRSTVVGTTPVVLARGQDGTLHAWVNRCAHKGAMVCRKPAGNQADGAFAREVHAFVELLRRAHRAPRGIYI